MSGLTRAASSDTLDLSGANITYVVVVAVIALVALGFAVALRTQRARGRPGHREDAGDRRRRAGGRLRVPDPAVQDAGLFAVLALVLLILLPADTASIRIGRSVFFLVGAVFSAFIGYAGMSLATRANVRVAAAARRRADGAARGHAIAFRTGGVVGILTVGLGLLGASPVVLIYKGDAPTVLEGFGFGAALLAMFMRVGGGIFTKAADVGADLVGKVEQGIPEDDPRNAATIADNVGDNVGDCAGMAADLFESYAVTLVAALILGKAAFGEEGLVFPLIVPAHRRDHRDHRHLPHQAAADRPQRHAGDQPRLLHLGRDLRGARARSPRSSTCRRSLSELTGVDRRRSCATPATGDPRLLAIVAVVIGIVLAAVIQLLTGYFTETSRRPVQDIGKTSLTGPATVDPRRHHRRPRVGRLLRAADRRGRVRRLPARRRLDHPGAVRVALAGTGLLTTVGVIVAMDTFGPISDNAQGIAEMSGDIDEAGAQVLTDLDAVGNTTKAITKGIAIATAVLAATALFGSFTDAVKTAVARHRRRRSTTTSGTCSTPAS